MGILDRFKGRTHTEEPEAQEDLTASQILQKQISELTDNYVGLKNKVEFKGWDKSLEDLFEIYDDKENAEEIFSKVQELKNMGDLRTLQAGSEDLDISMTFKDQIDYLVRRDGLFIKYGGGTDHDNLSLIIRQEENEAQLNKYRQAALWAEGQDAMMILESHRTKLLEANAILSSLIEELENYKGLKSQYEQREQEMEAYRQAQERFS